MAGGIYSDQPFNLNLKCIVFGGTLVASYWILPCRYDDYKFYTSGAMFVAAYVGMAQYDNAYGCTTGRLQHNPGLFNDITGWAKPTPTCGTPSVDKKGRIQFKCFY